MTWQDTVRSWGLVPLHVGMCKGMGWKMGQCCTRCRRCAESPDRPGDGANVGIVLRIARDRVAERQAEADLDHYRKLANAGRSTR